MKIEELTDTQRVVVYCTALAGSLVEVGLLSGGPELTEEGKRLAEELKASGYKPTKEEMKWFVRMSMIYGEAP
jgi:surface antigen